MKIVLSRKGFDSSIQGGGSPNWVHDDEIYPIPIPEVENPIRYSDLRFDDEYSYLEVMRDLNINQFTECHFDPYLSFKMLPGKSPARVGVKSLGQCDIAENILKEAGQNWDHATFLNILYTSTTPKATMLKDILFGP